MNFYDNLKRVSEKNNSLLCVGLDLDWEKIPDEFQKTKNGVFLYGKEIIDATRHLVCAYKPNIAFFEALGPNGLEQLELLMDYVPDEIPVILDFKRGDIGNTAKLYAKAAFERLGADAVTLSPYMGKDAVVPFLEYEGKFCFLLARTSNASSAEIQNLELKEGVPLFEKTAEIVSGWGDHERIGFVVGATRPEEMENLRTRFPEQLFLIPGVGSQGGDIDKTLRYGRTVNDGLAVVNVSRKIIFPGKGLTVGKAAEYYHGFLRKNQ